MLNKINIYSIPGLDRKPYTLENIIDKVCNRFDVTYVDIKSRKDTSNLCMARKVLMYNIDYHINNKKTSTKKVNTKKRDRTINLKGIANIMNRKESNVSNMLKKAAYDIQFYKEINIYTI